MPRAKWNGTDLLYSDAYDEWFRDSTEYLGISADTLYRYASEGLIPAFKLGNRWRFKRSLLDGWMVEQSGGSSSVSVMGDRKKPVRRAR